MVPRVGVILSINDPKLIEKIRYGKDHVNDDLYLCVYQAASRLWGFPKGRLRVMELREIGACRELNEETGIVLNYKDLEEADSLHIKRGKHHHYYYFKNLTTIPEVKIDNFEIINYSWLTL